MKTKNRILKLEQVKLDKDLYPRSKDSWTVACKYASVMRNGTIFPPVVVAKRGKEYVLVDGWHRVQAHKQNKKEHINAEILEDLNDTQIFEEAIRLNVGHGQSLTVYDKVQAIRKLTDMGLTRERISVLVQVPVTEMERFVANRAVNTLTGEVFAKNPVKHLAGQEIAVEAVDFEADQDSYDGVTQYRACLQLKEWLSKGYIDSENKRVSVLLKQIYELLHVQYGGLKK